MMVMLPPIKELQSAALTDLNLTDGILPTGVYRRITGTYNSVSDNNTEIICINFNATVTNTGASLNNSYTAQATIYPTIVNHDSSAITMLKGNDGSQGGTGGGGGGTYGGGSSAGSTGGSGGAGGSGGLGAGVAGGSGGGGGAGAGGASAISPVIGSNGTPGSSGGSGGNGGTLNSIASGGNGAGGGGGGGGTGWLDQYGSVLEFAGSGGAGASGHPTSGGGAGGNAAAGNGSGGAANSSGSINGNGGGSSPSGGGGGGGGGSTVPGGTGGGGSGGGSTGGAGGGGGGGGKGGPGSSGTANPNGASGGNGGTGGIGGTGGKPSKSLFLYSYNKTSGSITTNINSGTSGFIGSNGTNGISITLVGNTISSGNGATGGDGGGGGSGVNGYISVITRNDSDFFINPFTPVIGTSGDGSNGNGGAAAAASNANGSPGNKGVVGSVGSALAKVPGRIKNLITNSSITVMGIIPTIFSYNNGSALVLNANDSTNTYSPTANIANGITYTVSNNISSLPGSSINSSTGVLTIVPTSSAINITLIITATNENGSRSVNFIINILNIAPSGLSYNSGQTANPALSTSISYSPTLNQGTGDMTYTISPSLVSGLFINNSTGVISGTTPAIFNDTTYLITVTNSRGSTSANFRININDIAPSGLSYNSGQTATPLISTAVSYSPTLSLGTNITYSVSPSLPSGLSLNTSTGVISGTTPSSSNDTTYTITAANGISSTTASFRIRIQFFSGTINPKGVGGYSYDPSFEGYGYNSGYYSLGGDTSDDGSPQPVGSLSNNGSYTIGACMVFDFTGDGGGYMSSISVKGNHSTLSQFTKAIVNGSTYSLSPFNRNYASDRNYTYMNYNGNTYPGNFAWFSPDTSGTVSIVLE